VEILLDTIIPIDILSKDLATIAYGGISSDTGNFSWNFTPKTLRITAKSTRKGGKHRSLYRHVRFLQKQGIPGRDVIRYRKHGVL